MPVARSRAGYAAVGRHILAGEYLCRPKKATIIDSINAPVCLQILVTIPMINDHRLE